MRKHAFSQIHASHKPYAALPLLRNGIPIEGVVPVLKGVALIRMDLAENEDGSLTRRFDCERTLKSEPYRE